MRTVAVIPVRSGSKRVRHKNIKLLAGHPLLYYSIACAKQVKGIDKIIVATDDEEYARLARENGAEVLIRPPEISEPKSKTEEVLLFVLDQLEAQGDTYDNIMLIQATCPLTQPEHLRAGLEEMKDPKINSVLTYREFKGFFLDDPDLIRRPMTQDIPVKKLETGSFWVTRVAALRKNNNRIVPPSAHVKVPATAALDIDYHDELVVLEALLGRRMRTADEKYFVKRGYAGVSDASGFSEEISFINNTSNGGSRRNLLEISSGASIAPGFDAEMWDVKSVAVGEVNRRAFEEEHFSAVLCNEALERADDVTTLLNDLRRVLKTHSSLVIRSPNFGAISSRVFGEGFEGLRQPEHKWMFSDFTIRQFLEDHGFIVDRIEYPLFNTSQIGGVSVSETLQGPVMTVYCRKK